MTSTPDTSSTVVGSTRQRDFYLVPVPSWLRHREDKPLEFGLFLNAMFGIFATFSKSAFIRHAAYDVTYLEKRYQIFTTVSRS